MISCKNFLNNLRIPKFYSSAILLVYILQFVAVDSYEQVLPQLAYPATATVNYVRIWTASSPQQNAATLIASPLLNVKQSTQYFDGFGRTMQTVVKQASPLGNDMVMANCYDPVTGSEIVKYKAFTSNAATSGDVTNDGNFKLDRFQEQVAFYNTYLNGQLNETNVGSGSLNWAYSQTNYEASPLNRVLSEFAPGTNWVGSQSGSTPHGVQKAFWVNNATDNVQIWNIVTAKPVPQTLPQAQIIPTNNGAYLAGALYKTVVTDEQGHQTIEFTDKYGQVILKKVQNTAVADNETGSGHAGWLCTYYVYDDYGMLRFIIPPNVVDLISGSWTGITQSYVDELCYYFEYDNLNRMVIKKTPGTPTGVLGEVWMVYDERDRLVMQQDGYLRSQQKWKYFQYDGLDRVIATGLLTDPASNTTNYLDLNTHLNSAAASIAWPNLASYTTESFSQVFYDNYNWMSTANSSTLINTINTTTSGSANPVFTTSYNASPNYAQPITQSKQTHGMAMGGKIEVMGSNQSQYLYSINFYDSKGRVIQTQTINYLKGTDMGTAQYTWDGRVFASLVSHAIVNTTNPQSHWVASTLSYDAVGRLLSVSKTINSTVNGVSVSAYTSTVETNQYDELSELLTKKLGNNLESLTYGYNVRGWLLGENLNYISGASNTNYFALEIGYDKTQSVAPGNSYNTAEFTGNIEGATWKTKGDGINRKYDYTYDNGDRLLTASFKQNSSGTTWDNSLIDFSVSNLSYDANGNIGSLKQNGFLLGGTQPSGSQTINNLTYSYVTGKNGTTGDNYTNRLLNVMDASNMPTSTLGNFHYPVSKPPSGNTDYGYDQNGNITSDYNRSVSAISYWNEMNLPNTVTITGKGAIQYTYDAAGNKLMKLTTQNNATVSYNGANYTTNIVTTTKYIDGFVYKTVNYSNASLSALNLNNTDVLLFTGHEDGRIRFKPALGTVVASYAFDYFLKDNQGNVRMVLTDESQTDIYPAATLETTAYGGGVAEAVESQYYNINTANIKTTATQLPWFAADQNSTYVNNNGTPANPDPYSSPGNSANVYWLNGQTGSNMGLGITLKVMAGDQISIFGKSVWHNTGTTASNTYVLTSSLLNFFSAFASSPAVIASGQGITATTLSSATPTTTLLTPMLNTTPTQTQNTTYAPKAAINWILFDDQFRPVNMGTTLVNSQPDIVTAHNFPLNIPMIKNGYVYVYCSNESNIDVYFDNLQVTLTHGPIVEETHYYPTGLTMAGISDRAFGKQQNYYHYQGDEMQNQEWNDGTGLEEYDFQARYYDQQLGVWHNQDPSSQYASPYLAMGNNWPNGFDPNGENFWRTLEDIGIIAGSAVAAYFTVGISLSEESQIFAAGGIALAGYAGASIESGSLDPGKWDANAWKGAITGELIAGAVFVGGEVIAGNIATGTSAGLGAQIAFGAATGVGQGVFTTEVTSLETKNELSWNWDQMFVATVSGAITGAIGSDKVKGSIDNFIWGTTDVAGKVVSNVPAWLNGVASSVIGVAATTAFKEWDKGWNEKDFFKTLWPALAGSAASKIATNEINNIDPLKNINTNPSGIRVSSYYISKFGGASAQQLMTSIIGGTSIFKSIFNSTFLWTQYTAGWYKWATTAPNQ